MKTPKETGLNPNVTSYIQESEFGFGNIPDERRAQLKKIAIYVQSRTGVGQEARLTFICTHNSRRSHMAQIWAQTAAAHYRVPKVATYSGGTEATAFNPRAVAALERAGLSIAKTSDGENPVYEVGIVDKAPAIKVFSKVYNEKPNPAKDYCAIMTCSQADANCPVVEGATQRVSIPYDDPKDFDGTDREEEQYDERCRQICTEMLYAFSLIERST
jgi:protein-tyrosine phosphatase/arsenate reductase